MTQLYKMKYLFLILVLLTSFSCKKKEVEVISDKNIVKTETLAQKSTILEPAKSIETSDEFFFPKDSVFIGNILYPGEYHKEEIDLNLKKQNWIGLFQNNLGYYLKKTKIDISFVNDAVVDEENEKTGRNIIVSEKKDSCHYIFSKIDNLKEGKVKIIRPHSDTKPLTIHPTKPYKFNLNGVDYELFSTAKTFEKFSKENYFFDATQYRLYIKNLKTGNQQLLSAQSNFDDKMIEILFIGDFDGDNLPDFIIDNSRHYNSFAPTFYLSSYAIKNEMVKIVAIHDSVGC